jgi:hypothetical protein
MPTLLTSKRAYGDGVHEFTMRQAYHYRNRHNSFSHAINLQVL